MGLILRRGHRAPEVNQQEGTMHPARSIRRAAVPAALIGITLAVIAALAADAPPAPQEPLPVALVHALNKLAGGPHTGFRANHAKGVLVTGTFTPSKEAAGFSKAEHNRRTEHSGRQQGREPARHGHPLHAA